MFTCRNRTDTVSVWQVPATHNIPEDKRKTNWYEGEDGAEVNGSIPYK